MISALKRLGTTGRFFSFGLMLTACLLLGGREARALEAPAVSEAQGWVVEDLAGNVLASHNADTLFPPASITKVMTAMVALDSGISFDTVVTMPELPEDWYMAQVAGFNPGTTATFGELMDVMLVFSANDAAYAIALTVSGSEAAFGEAMTAKAHELGMQNTTFKNPHGLDQDGHMSTAADLALMGRYALSHYPYIAETVQKRSVTIPVNGQQITYQSTDYLMDTYKPLIGIKTGRSNETTTFLGAAASAPATLYSCVLGCETSEGRFTDTQTLFEWAYNTYKPLTLAREGQVRVWYPFAWRFGYKVASAWDAGATGYSWPEGGPTTYRMISAAPTQLMVPSVTVGVCRWQQDGRTLAARSITTLPAVVKALPELPTYGGLLVRRGV